MDEMRKARRPACKEAAFKFANHAVYELKNVPLLGEAGKILFDIEKKIVSLGGSSIKEWLKPQAEDTTRGAIRDALCEQPTGVYQAPTVRMTTAPSLSERFE